MQRQWIDSMKPITSGQLEFKPMYLILRSALLGARLEGWPLVRPHL